jgi:NAD(P)-dependent dehydrogenase (short-subunit alcohol dehydrogenase family)
MKLKDKVAIVVGGGNGIGRASAKLLAQEGAKVMIADLVIENANKVADDIRATGGEVSTFQMDMTKEEDCKKMVEATLKKYGKIDILCNIAGGSLGPNIRDNLEPFAGQTKEMWDRIIDINLNGARNCTRAVINHMMERRSGKIVSFSSIAAINGMQGGVDYSAAKAGIIAFTKSLAMEMSPYGVYVNCVTPSGTASERIKKSMLARQQGQQGGGQAPAMSMFAEPEELAEAVLFLVSDASNHMSGQNIIFGVPTAPGPR